jgi:membrane carboxypeptidase/penicillin-binding protein PbpC
MMCVAVPAATFLRALGKFNARFRGCYGLGLEPGREPGLGLVLGGLGLSFWIRSFFYFFVQLVLKLCSMSPYS